MASIFLSNLINGKTLEETLACNDCKFQQFRHVLEKSLMVLFSSSRVIVRGKNGFVFFLNI